MHYKAVEKLLQEHLAGEPPLILAEDEIPAFLARLKQALASSAEVNTEIAAYQQQHYPNNKRDPRNLCRIRCELPEQGSGHWYGYRDHSLSLWLGHEAGGKIAVIQYQDPIAYLGSIEALIRLCEGYRERVQRAYNQAAKRQKVRNLRVQAMIARIKEVAKEQGFDFQVEHNTQNCWLYVRTSSRDCIVIRIPWRRFQEVLPKLGDLILKAREIYAEGIQFGIGQARGANWIKHTDL